MLKGKTMKSLLTVAILLMSSLSFAGPTTVQGLPQGLKLAPNMLETLQCTFMHYDLILNLPVTRSARRLGYGSVLRRNGYAVMQNTNFDIANGALLTDRQPFTISGWNSPTVNVSFEGDMITIAGVDENDPKRESTSISQECRYTYGVWDDLFHQFAK